MDHLANLTQFRAIFHELKSGLCEHEERLGEVVGVFFLPLLFCLLLRLRLLVSLLLCCIVFGLLLCCSLCIFARILMLLHIFLCFLGRGVSLLFFAATPSFAGSCFLASPLGFSVFLSPSVDVWLYGAVCGWGVIGAGPSCARYLVRPGSSSSSSSPEGQ